MTEPPPRITADEEADNIQLMPVRDRDPHRFRWTWAQALARSATSPRRRRRQRRPAVSSSAGRLRRHPCSTQRNPRPGCSAQGALFDRYTGMATEDLSYEELADGLFRLKPHPLADVESRRLMVKIPAGIVTSEGILRPPVLWLQPPHHGRLLGYLPGRDELLVCPKTSFKSSTTRRNCPGSSST